MLHREQKMWNSIKKYSVVHPLMRISIIGFFSLLYIGMILDTPDVTEAQQKNSPVESMIREVFGPHAQAAIRVARCESGLNAGAYNPTGFRGSHSAGVFQILYPSTWRGTSQATRSPYNPVANIVAAHDIFVRDGYRWRAWVCRP
jgi:hypothetical protein